jgi:hypothetical protein
VNRGASPSGDCLHLAATNQTTNQGPQRQGAVSPDTAPVPLPPTTELGTVPVCCSADALVVRCLRMFAAGLRDVAQSLAGFFDGTFTVRNVAQGDDADQALLAVDHR